jgi:hypothetical protein
MIQVSVLLVVLSCAGGLEGTERADASFGRAGWEISSTTYPTNLNPGSKGVVLVQPLNIGAASSSGQITITDTLPRGLKASDAGAVQSGGGKPSVEPEAGIDHSHWECSIAPGGEDNSVVSCHNGSTLPSIAGGGGLPVSYAAVHNVQPPLKIAVEAAAQAPEGQAANEMRIEGGGAFNPIQRSDPLTISSTPAPFGLARWQGWASNADGTLDTQAGSVPYSATFSFDLGTVREAGASEELTPAGGELRNIDVELPPGLVGNPQAVAQCTRAQFDTEKCPRESIVGAIEPIAADGVALHRLVFNLQPAPGHPAELAFTYEGISVFLVPGIRTGTDYGITTQANNAPQRIIISSQLTLWGVPNDPSHVPWRCGSTGGCEPGEGLLGPDPPLKPFLTLPTSCAGPQPFTERASSWLSETDFTEPLSFLSSGGDGSPSAFQDCGAEPFEPSIAATPSGSAADSPMGLDFDLHIPQHEKANAVEEGAQKVGAESELATAQLKDAVVTLPQGVTVDPSSANGLGVCTPAQFGLTSPVGVLPVTTTPDPATCPSSAKVGEVEVDTPLLDHPLLGGVYVAAPRENPFGSLLAIYIVVDDRQTGVVVKLAGHVQANEQTGQLTTSFQQNPQLPFEDFHLRFFSGPAAALRSPATCGTFTSTSQMTPWSSPEGADALPQSSFQITGGAGGGSCASSDGALPFAPSFSLGTVTKAAGAFTPLVVSFARADGQQPFGRLSVTTPPGLSGYISHVPECPEPQAAEGNCPDASLIGEVSTAVGAGPRPYWVNGGKVYLTGPYNGGPYGLSIVVPATAGPYTLNGNGGFGREIVRSSIRIDPYTAQITVVSDPLPQILEGIPLDVRQINVTINRPQEFIFNPTNCATSLASSATQTSTLGASSSSSSPFYPAGCSTLKFPPKFAPSTSAKTSRAAGASLTAKLSYPRAPQGTQTNIAYVKVTVPKQLPSRLTTLQKACTAQVFEANPASCPAASIVGHAIVHTPVLPVALEGPAYFVSHGNAAFPNLTMVLQGYGVTVILVGDTLIRGGITTTTFKSVPDVPFETFELKLPEGPYSALAANANLCQEKLSMPIEYHAQNGAELKQDPAIEVQGCPNALAVVSKKVKGKSLSLKVYVPAAGKLAVSGRGLSKASQKAKGREVLSIGVKEKHGRRLKSKLRLTFSPATGKKLAKAVTVRFRG